MICKDTKRGTWTVRYWRKNTEGKLTPTTKRGFLTKNAARQFEMDVSHSSLSSTFFDLYKEYIARMDCSDEEKHTRLHYCEEWVNFKDFKIDSISKPVLAKWNDFLKTECNLSPTTKNRIISYVKGTYRYANEIYDIKDISSVLKSFPKETEEKEILTIDEFNKMLSFETNPIIRAFFYTAYWTGCRRGELKGLYKEDLVDHGFIIKHTMRLGKDSLKEGNKTTKLYKTIQLDDETYKILLELSKREGLFLFGDEAPLSNETIRRHLSNNLKEAGITKHITMHCLRHSHGSILLANGVDIATVSKRLRHKSINTTLSTYIHILDDDGKITVDAIEKIKKSS